MKDEGGGMNGRVMKASALSIPHPSSLIPHPFLSVSRRGFAPQGGVERDLVEGGDQDAFGFGVAGGEQVELRNLTRQHAEPEQLVPDRRRLGNLLRVLVERIEGAPQL